MNSSIRGSGSKLAVSIIIPVWNTGEYLEESVCNAIAELEGIEGEVILVDDFSDDVYTLQALERCRALSSCLRILINDSGVKGAGAARNYGTQHAQGEWLVFLDSDDVFIPGSVAKRLAVAKEHPNIQWMSADFYKWYPPNPLKGKGYFADRVESYPAVRDALESKSIIIRKSPVDELFSDFMPVNTLVVMVKKDLFLSLGGFSTTLQKAEDTFLWLKLAFAEAPFAFYPYPVGKYRIRENSLTHEDQASGFWKAALYKAFYYDPLFSAYKKQLKRKISKGYLSDSYYYRKKNKPAATVRNALCAIHWNPADKMAWKSLLAGLASVTKLVS
ncbi:MAG: glycosyltransferase family 2 protein [Gammaproteobacteria bacterium]|nr:glycosyltransferase family 2 protein [Gammaproteobacteria bacterium]